MDLQLNASLAENYTSNSQKARVITEQWVSDNMFCPRCGNKKVCRFENNKPVADFYCQNCDNQYELKSHNSLNMDRINDGAYSTMIERITSADNPDFFFMSYSKTNWLVQSFYFVPKHFFIPGIIEKRAPLAPTARRAGWIGCNILLGKIPSTGKIPIIENGVITDKKNVLKKVSLADSLIVSDIIARGWLMDVLTCVEKIARPSFTLSEVYKYEDELASTYPGNHNIRPKIRQQLQVLRDRGIIKFIKPGEYKRIL